ncbi:hypothetical protein TL16_g07799 [Triparma laevis f. inornata]|uniref:Uncharacterized protein n=2 Tax=Triparma laevis TaxID=1534972 RepID=A0A9W6ZWL2_9STRA|nr:hypothetical protein TrLO_g1731 [Triparma laevis f. longispina]GMH78429.1 hypothetical protein TL16_g07799 [Triparma laevis f. inornata]
MSLASYKKRGIVYVTGSTKDEHAPASENLGREIALAGYSLMTGGGRGVALAVGRGFCSVPRVERKGASIGVVWGAVGGYTIPGYPNEFVEVTAQLNLPSNKIGEHKVTSRNHLNDADVCIIFPGDSMTRMDLDTCVGYEHPTIVHPYWSDCCPSLWDFQDMDDCMAIVNGVFRDRTKRPSVHKMKVANVLEGKTAEGLRKEESIRTLSKGKENEEYAKEQERIEQARLLAQPGGEDDK